MEKCRKFFAYIVAVVLLSNFFFFFFGLRKPFEQTWLVNVITYYISFINIRENCTLPTCGLTRFNSVYQWFKSYYLTHLRWFPLDSRYPPLSLSLKNPLYYISHNKNRIRSNILKNDLSLTILEIKSSNPNPISWPKSCLINTIIGSLLMYIIPTIYIKSCHKKKKRKNPQLKLQTQIARENKKEPINPLTPKKFESTNPPLSAASISADLYNQVALLLSWSHNSIFLVSLFFFLVWGFGLCI